MDGGRSGDPTSVPPTGLGVAAGSSWLALPLPAVALADGVVVHANDAALQLGPHAALDVPLAQWFDEADADQVARALWQGTGGTHVAVRVRDRDTWCALHTGPAEGDLQLVLLRDASDEQMARAAVDEVAASTFVIDAAGGNRWRSARLRERSGTPDEVAAVTPAGERIHPEDLPVVFETFARVTPDQPLSVNTRSRAVDDDDRWEWIEMVVWHRIDHEVLKGYLVQVHNLDEGRTVKTTLADADADLLSLTDAAPVGIAVTDPAGQIVYRNPAAHGLLGPDVRSFGQGDWLALALPEHRNELAGAFGAALRDREERTVTAAFESQQSDAPRWLRMRVRSQRSDTARPTGVIATIEDVTEQVEARSALEAAEERMRHLATHDTLTGLPNRAALADELERATSRHARTGAGLGVLFLDLNDFKPVNDRLGHAGGDAVLVEVARRFRGVVRETDFLARLGGDEFVVLCEGTGTTTEVVDELAVRLHAQLERDIDVDGTAVRVGTAIGIALLAPDAPAVAVADDLLLQADQAMYDAKPLGIGGTKVRWIGRR